MIDDLVLNKYLIDVVQPVLIPEPGGALHSQVGQVQMITYMVVAGSAEQALDSFFKDGAGVVFYEGEVVDRILIGIQQMEA